MAGSLALHQLLRIGPALSFSTGQSWCRLMKMVEMLPSYLTRVHVKNAKINVSTGYGCGTQVKRSKKNILFVKFSGVLF